MKKFQYKAKTEESKTVTGIVEAANKKEAARILRDKKLLTFYLKERGQDNFNSLFLALRGISSRDIADFTRQLSTMVEAGLPLTDALTIIQEQSKPAMSKIVADLVKEIEGGSSFYDALVKHADVFSKIYLALIKSGEAAGSLDKVLKRMADSLEQQEEFKSKVKGAMVYPVIVLVGMVLVIFIMMVYVVPKLTSMYEEFGTTLPMSTKILIGTSKVVSRYWFIFIAICGMAFYAFNMWRATPVGGEKVDRIILKLPIMGVLQKKVILTEICQTLAMLLSAGVTIIEALNIVAEAANNAVFENSIKRVAKDVEKGFPLTSVFERFEEYPPIFNQMVAVGEETGKLDEVLLRLSRQFSMEAETAVKGLTTAIEPLMMIVLGIGVGFIVVSIITPIYNLTSQF
jgi:type IV pilus assembly protein PilC